MSTASFPSPPPPMPPPGNEGYRSLPPGTGHGSPAELEVPTGQTWTAEQPGQSVPAAGAVPARRELPISPPPERAREKLHAVAALAAIVFAVVGIPVLLTLLLGAPIMHGGGSGAVTRAIFSLLLWAGWAHFVACLFAEWRAEVRGSGLAPRIPFGGPPQAGARRLVVTALLLSGTTALVVPVTYSQAIGARPRAAGIPANADGPPATGTRTAVGVPAASRPQLPGAFPADLPPGAGPTDQYADPEDVAATVPRRPVDTWGRDAGFTQPARFPGSAPFPTPTAATPRWAQHPGPAQHPMPAQHPGPAQHSMPAQLPRPSQRGLAGGDAPDGRPDHPRPDRELPAPPGAQGHGERSGQTDHDQLGDDIGPPEDLEFGGSGFPDLGSVHASSVPARSTWPRSEDTDPDTGARPSDRPELIGPIVDDHRGIVPAERVVKLYEVRSAEGRHHDTLWGIAERFLGDGLRYREIFDLNEGRTQPDGRTLSKPSLIHAGWVLLLPADAQGDGLRILRLSEATAGWSTAIKDVDEDGDGDLLNDDLDGDAHGVVGTGRDDHHDPNGPGSDRFTTDHPGGEDFVPVPALPAEPSDEDESGMPESAATEGGLESGPRAFASSDRFDPPAPAAASLVPARGFAGIATAGLLAAGVLAALGRHRSVAGNDASSAGAAHEALVLAADVDTAHFVDQALRALAVGLTAQRRLLPPVYAAILTDETLILHMAPPEANPPPAPWLAGEVPGSWRIDRGAGLFDDPDLPTDAALAADQVPAPYPALVSFGHDDSGSRILVDLEGAPGVISLLGDRAAAVQVAMTIALELATNVWSDDLRVCLIGFPPDTAFEGLLAIAPERLWTAPSVAHALDELSGPDDEEAVTHLGDTDFPLEAGQRIPGNPEALAPDLLIIAEPVDAAGSERLSRMARGRRHAIGVLTIGDLPIAQWRFTVQANRRMSLGVLGVEVWAQALGPDEYTAVAGLFQPASQDQAASRRPAALAPGPGPAALNPPPDPAAPDPAARDEITRPPALGSVPGAVPWMPPPLAGPPFAGPVPTGPISTEPISTGPASALDPTSAALAGFDVDETRPPAAGQRHPAVPPPSPAEPSRGDPPTRSHTNGENVDAPAGRPAPLFRPGDPLIRPTDIPRVPPVLYYETPRMRASRDVDRAPVPPAGPSAAAPVVDGPPEIGPPPEQRVPTAPPVTPPRRPPIPPPGEMPNGQQVSATPPRPPGETTGPASQAQPGRPRPGAPYSDGETTAPAHPTPTVAAPAAGLSTPVPAPPALPPAGTPAPGAAVPAAGPPPPPPPPPPAGTPAGGRAAPLAAEEPPATGEAQVRILGAPTVEAPGRPPVVDTELLTEIIIYLALHREGAHERTLAEEIWFADAGPVADGVVSAVLARAGQWLGVDAAGGPRLAADLQGRWRLSPDVRCDWELFVAYTHRADLPGSDTEADLTTALRMVSGPLWTGLPDQRYRWATTSAIARSTRAGVVDVAHRLAGLTLDFGDTMTAMAACRTGLRAVPAAQVLWRDLLRTVATRGDRRTLEAVVTEMYRTISADGSRRGGRAEAETDALVQTLLPGYRRTRR
ncbi:Peptidoglycan-binding protein LysM [Frankia sp. AiPs1]|uniref:LysM peptidoglycan-binding domain-containing protein n=1 Tax=Frankia sp. AiPa1 TaxID=573492 RepID=UPI00202AE609|nr:LysM peptidoglycan-binding domain-containing protein [Frankia sp. AiPa1]MCL9759955.1 LysM peptidoglycan-binding domain-containing protein [Frankia sp. AiPa1]